jgi:hypothetical protein
VRPRARARREPFVDRQHLLTLDAQRLVELAAGLQYVRDLPQRDRARAHVVVPFEDW